jgi:hypothetical protein
MLKNINKSTIVICCFLGLNIIISGISLFIPSGDNEVFNVNDAIDILISVLLLLSIYQLLKDNLKAFYLSLGFSVFQVFTLEAEQLTLGLQYGLKIGASVHISDIIVTINIMALFAAIYISSIIRDKKLALK